MGADEKLEGLAGATGRGGITTGGGVSVLAFAYFCRNAGWMCDGAAVVVAAFGMNIAGWAADVGA